MEEQLEDLAGKAGNLGLHGVPVFVFQEGRDRIAERAFKEIARLSKGAWFRFDRNSAATLAKLLVGGRGVRHRRAEGARGARPAGGPADDREHAERQGAMSAVLGILAAVLVAGRLVVAAFLRRRRARGLPSGLRLAGPAVLAIVGVRADHHRPRGHRRHAAVGGASPGTASSRVKRARGEDPGPALDGAGPLRLKWSSTTIAGGLEGMVLAGRHEQKTLGGMTLERAARSFTRNLPADSESRQLLETYLDGRFPVWRERR